MFDPEWVTLLLIFQIVYIKLRTKRLPTVATYVVSHSHVHSHRSPWIVFSVNKTFSIFSFNWYFESVQCLLCKFITHNIIISYIITKSECLSMQCVKYTVFHVCDFATDASWSRITPKLSSMVSSVSLDSSTVTLSASDMSFLSVGLFCTCIHGWGKYSHYGNKPSMHQLSEGCTNQT